MVNNMVNPQFDTGKYTKKSKHIEDHNIHIEHY